MVDAHPHDRVCRIEQVVKPATWPKRHTPPRGFGGRLQAPAVERVTDHAADTVIHAIRRIEQLRAIAIVQVFKDRSARQQVLVLRSHHRRQLQVVAKHEPTVAAQHAGKRVRDRQLPSLIEHGIMKANLLGELLNLEAGPGHDDTTLWQPPAPRIDELHARFTQLGIKPILVARNLEQRQLRRDATDRKQRVAHREIGERGEPNAAATATQGRNNFSKQPRLAGARRPPARARGSRSQSQKLPPRVALR